MEQTNTKVVEYQVCCAMTLYIHIMCVAQISICMYGMPHDIYIYMDGYMGLRPIVACVEDLATAQLCCRCRWLAAVALENSLYMAH